MRASPSCGRGRSWTHGPSDASKARGPSWYLETAAALVDVKERSEVADHVIANEDRPAADVAMEALRLSGWLP